LASQEAYQVWIHRSKSWDCKLTAECHNTKSRKYKPKSKKKSKSNKRRKNKLQNILLKQKTQEEILKDNSQGMLLLDGIERLKSSCCKSNMSLASTFGAPGAY